MEKFKRKRNSGITLIALVITIIVLLILAGISLNLVMGEGGILTRAKKARKANDIAGVKEKIELKASEYSHDYLEKRYVKQELGANSKAGDFVASKIKEYATANSTLDNCNITYTENTKTIIITENGYSETGTIQEDGSIKWDGATNDGSGADNDNSVTTQKQWEFATGGDKDSSGTLTVGDLVKPKIASVASEQFYVIGKDDTAGTVTLLAEKNVKTNDATAANNVQSSSANTLAFDSSTNVFANASIKGKVDAYVSILTGAGLTLEDVEINPDTHATAKGRLIWGTATGSWDSNHTTWNYTSGTGEVGALLDAGLTDIVYESSTAWQGYWLGSPCADDAYRVWMVLGYYGGSVDDMSFYYDDECGLCPVIEVLQSKF